MMQYVDHTQAFDMVTATVRRLIPTSESRARQRSPSVPFHGWMKAARCFTCNIQNLQYWLFKDINNTNLIITLKSPTNICFIITILSSISSKLRPCYLSFNPCGFFKCVCLKSTNKHGLKSMTRSSNPIKSLKLAAK